MRKAVVSLAAVLMMLASIGSVSAAPPISSSGSNSKVSISVDGPTVVTAGGTARFTGTITLVNDGTAARKPVVFNMALLSEDDCWPYQDRGSLADDQRACPSGSVLHRSRRHGRRRDAHGWPPARDQEQVVLLPNSQFAILAI